MSCCRKCRGSSRQVQGNLQTLENIGGCPVETVCGCQEPSTQPSCGCNGNGESNQNNNSCCQVDSGCTRTAVTCRSPSPSTNCNDPDVPIYCCGHSNCIDCEPQPRKHCCCHCCCHCCDDCCDDCCQEEDSCQEPDNSGYRLCCDECGCCRMYPCQWRNPYWPEFSHPRWL